MTLKNDKKSKIKSIKDVSELILITEAILNETGFQDTDRLDGYCVEAKLQIPQGTYKHLYIHSVLPLSKNSSIKTDLKRLIEKNKSEGYVLITIISKDTISKGFRQKFGAQYPTLNFEYWGTDELLEKIETSYDEYWRHSDQSLLKYERDFKDYCNEFNDIKSIDTFKESYEKIISVFIQPKLYKKTKDYQSSQPSFELQQIKDLVDYQGLNVIVGEAGSGKTRLLKEIAIKLTNENLNKKGKRNLTVFLNATNINENKDKDNKISLHTAISNKLKVYFSTDLESLIQQYQLYIFIDTIDEFEKKIQKKICQEIKDLLDKDVIFFLGTRLFTTSQISGLSSLTTFDEIHLPKFDDGQVRQFVTRYFNTENADGLLASLRENKILEKLPITPLNLSLLSLLYEKHNYEIPATVTDIYLNFSNLLLGRSVVDERLKFIDITFKENILSMYAIKLLEMPNNEFLTRKEFISFFEKEFSDISSSINLSLLPEALDYLIKHTGFLTIHEEKYVKFRHDSYMEYFAALEVFKNDAKSEDLFVENFFDINWQFAAVFYAGFSRRRPRFLDKITQKVKSANKFKEYASGVGGIGYIIQSLYMTSDKKRKDAILVALDKIIDLFELTKKLSSEDIHKVFRRFKVHFLAIFNTFLFFENFNSITIKEPLNDAFEDLFNQYKALEGTSEEYINNYGFKLFVLAITLSSVRIGNHKPFEKLVMNTNLINDPFFEHLFHFGLDFVKSSAGIQKIRSILKKERIISLKSRNKNDKSNYFPTVSKLDNYLSKSLFRVRFSKFDKIRPERNIKIITEGKTDAVIIEHAFMVLTNQTVPYWEIKPSDYENGGAAEVAKVLSHSGVTLEDDSMIIGIFDNDSKGIQEFKGGLKPHLFDKLHTTENGVCRIKKHNTFNIFGLLLPIPPSMQHFIVRKEQHLNYFAIEHYFPLDFLKKHEMIEKSEVEGLYKIKSSKSKKNDFAKKILKLRDTNIFKNFIYLFYTIDKICNKENDVEYTFKIE